MTALFLLACLNGTHVGLVSVGCSAWWRSSKILFHVQVAGKAPSVVACAHADIWGSIGVNDFFLFLAQLPVVFMDPTFSA
jgi:hypothetical protein